MMTWIDSHQFIFISLCAMAIAAIAYHIGSSSKRDELQLIIADYESLLNESYTDRQNLITALASIQAREEGTYLGYRVAMKRMDNN